MTNPIADPLVEVTDTDVITDLVLIEATEAGAVTVTLNRPERKNALNGVMLAGLAQAFETLHSQDGVRVVFVRGAGGAFCTGGDPEWLQATAEHTEQDHREDFLQMAQMLKLLHDIPALTVALVEGGASGGGAGIICACDMAVCTADAEFAFAEVRVGLLPATVSPYVVAAVGPRTARGLFATGRSFNAAHAERIGLVSEVVADAAALEQARDRIARDILACAPGAVAEAKALVDAVAYQKVDHGLMEETARAIARARVSDEGVEGVGAYIEKRRPGWAVS
jgi:methylglutaconyl-CoA hydratase